MFYESMRVICKLYYNLYEMFQKISTMVKKTRMAFYGHLIRQKSEKILDENCVDPHLPEKYKDTSTMGKFYKNLGNCVIMKKRLEKTGKC